MKKYIFVFAIFFAFAMNGQAQSWKDVLGKVVNKVAEDVSDKAGDNVISNVLGNIIGNSVPFSKALIEGTWIYEGTACVLESENALSDIGGTVVTSQVEEKLDGYLAKVGVKPGTCSFTFFESDTCVFSLNGYELQGTYELDVEEKIIHFNFLRDNLKMKSYLSYNVTDINIVFDADKLLNLLKKVTSKTKSSEKKSSLFGSKSSALSTASASLNTISTLLDNYDGMMLGMKLKK